MLKVATHNGTFHADDVFAYAILRSATGGRLDLLRTRDLTLFPAMDVVFDVGGSYDRDARRYDHHMRDRPVRATGEPYSSAGLVWRDYGATAASRILPDAGRQEIARIVAMVDCGLIRDIDLMDNGAMAPTPGHVSTLIETFNPTFAETTAGEDTAFLQAAELAGAILTRASLHAWDAVQAEATVAAAAAAAEDPRILVLDSKLPWEDAVFDLNLADALYVIRPSGDHWTCSAVPPERGSFAQRKPLPRQWGGLRDQTLAELTGVVDATFCHPGLFVCGARSRQGVLAMARMAVS
ncbi:MAG TPA: MYG1 family protein [Rhodospirillaceae bacterium]|nr:MYG1 family protein [Rhodospirillaceae bacterium]